MTEREEIKKKEGDCDIEKVASWEKKEGERQTDWVSLKEDGKKWKRSVTAE